MVANTNIPKLRFLDILENDFITYEKIIGKVYVELDTLEKYPVNYGDIIFQRSSETRKEVGTASVYLDKEKRQYYKDYA